MQTITKEYAVASQSDHVHPESLKHIPRIQTSPSRWSGQGWKKFIDELKAKDINIREDRCSCAPYLTDAGGLGWGRPHGVLSPRSADDVSKILKAAQSHRVPVTVRGGGLTTEGETVAYGGLLLDMTSMNQVISIDPERMTVKTQTGIFWHQLAEVLRRDGLDYLSAPLNLTSTVGGTLGVGGIDVNSPHYGCSADQALELEVVLPTGEITACSETENTKLFNLVLLGYGQFGVITQAVLKIRKYTPVTMQYVYYSSLTTAIKDMQWLVREDAADYCGILTMMDKVINLLVAFDSEERKKEFELKFKNKLKGHGEPVFALQMGLYYMLHPWRAGEALYLVKRRSELLRSFHPPHHINNGKLIDRAVVFSKSVWKFWGGKRVVIPDLSSNAEKFIEAVERGNAVCKKYFKYYTLYCVGIKLCDSPRYEMSCIPPDAKGFGYGCEFEPMLRGMNLSRDYLQSFENDIYDIGVDMRLSYYRFGGQRKAYIRKIFPREIVDKYFKKKQELDPSMILNPDVIF
ncbi:FAD-binding oxidoreductase [Elusimicrobiota bacterium]